MRAHGPLRSARLSLLKPGVAAVGQKKCVSASSSLSLAAIASPCDSPAPQNYSRVVLHTIAPASRRRRAFPWRAEPEYFVLPRQTSTRPQRVGATPCTLDIRPSFSPACSPPWLSSSSTLLPFFDPRSPTSLDPILSVQQPAATGKLRIYNASF